MSQNRFVTVNSNASIFHDQSTGITVVNGQIKELTPAQLNSRRIRNALASGHLIYANKGDEKTLQEISEDKVKVLLEKFKGYVKSGVDKKKLEKIFTEDELKAISKSIDIIPDKGDTKATLIDAIIEDINEKK